MRLNGFTIMSKKLRAVGNLPAIRDWLSMYYNIELDEYGYGVVGKIPIRYLPRCGELQVGDDDFDRWANSVDIVFDVWLNKGMREFDRWLKEKIGEENMYNLNLPNENNFDLDSEQRSTLHSVSEQLSDFDYTDYSVTSKTLNEINKKRVQRMKNAKATKP